MFKVGDAQGGKSYSKTLLRAGGRGVGGSLEKKERKLFEKGERVAGRDGKSSGCAI